jgi:hypothetical protein
VSPPSHICSRERANRSRIKILDALPGLENVIFTITDHTLQKDLVKPYVPWTLGPLSAETCLSDDFRHTEQYAKGNIAMRRRELKNNVDVKIDLMSIHQRGREYLPMDQLKRPLQGWEMDWFG